jgi:amidase
MRGNCGTQIGAGPYAMLANAAGLPAISVPQGLDTAGLPLAIQIVGPSR